MDAIQLRFKRCAQGACREYTPVANAAAPIHDRYGKILRDRGVLESVVHDNRIGLPFHGCMHTRRAVTRHDGRCDAGEQQRFVAHIDGTLMVDPNRARDPAAIATRQKERTAAQFQHEPGERDGGGSLTGTAQREIADADDRHRRLSAWMGHVSRYDRPVAGAYGREQGCGRTMVSPPESGVTHGRRCLEFAAA